MAEFKIPRHGEVCWRELSTSNLESSINFYSNLFGWAIERSKLMPMEYDEIHFNGTAVGGMMAIDEKWGPEPPPSHWTTYIAVENADETVEKIKAYGGSVRVPPFDAPSVGRLSMVSDPSGADFAIIQFVQPE